MSITATMFQTSIEVKIAGSLPEFDRDLEAFKASVDPADREWLPGRNVWLIRHPAKYYHLHFVQVCMTARKAQLSLF